MNQRITALERAFQLAKSGSCKTVSDIKSRLRAEGYSVDKITGPTLSKQLQALIQTARGQPKTKDQSAPPAQ
jgi:hypothetical protein